MIKRGTAPPEIAGLYAPQGVDLGGGGPLKKEQHITEKVACAEKHCKVRVTTTLMWFMHSTISNASLLLLLLFSRLIAAVVRVTCLLNFLGDDHLSSIWPDRFD